MPNVVIHSPFRQSEIGAYTFTLEGRGFSGSVTFTGSFFPSASGTIESVSYESFARVIEYHVNASIPFLTATCILSHSVDRFEIRGVEPFIFTPRINVANALGMEADISISSSLVTSSFRPHFIWRQSYFDVMNPSLDYESDNIVKERKASDGQVYAVRRLSSSISRDWTFEVESPENVFKEYETTDVPWTLERFFQYNKVKPFLVYHTGSENINFANRQATYKLRAEGTVFKPTATVQGNYSLWNHTFQTYVIGRPASDAVIADLVANVVAPVIAGTVEIGLSPTITEGTWTGSPTLTYTLRRSGTPITGLIGVSIATIEAYAYVLADMNEDITVAEIPNGETANQAISNIVSGLITPVAGAMAIYDGSGAAVDGWTNDGSSGASANLTKLGSNAALGTLDGKTIVDFAGVTGFAMNAGVVDFGGGTGVGYSILVVAQTPATFATSAHRLFAGGVGAAGSNSPLMQVPAGGTEFHWGTGATSTGVTATVSTWYALMMTGDQSSGVDEFFEGADWSTPDHSINHHSLGFDGVTIGSHHSGVVPWHGKVAAYYIYPRILTADERTRMRAFFAQEFPSV